MLHIESKRRFANTLELIFVRFSHEIAKRCFDFVYIKHLKIGGNSIIIGFFPCQRSRYFLTGSVQLGWGGMVFQEEGVVQRRGWFFSGGLVGVGVDSGLSTSLAG